MQDATTFNNKPAGSTAKAVVFDLDDTLYPQQQYVLSGFRAVASYVNNLYSIDIFQELTDAFYQGAREDIFERVLSRHFRKVEEPLVRKLLYVHRTHTPRLDLYPDARVCLALLISRELRIGVLTDGASSIQRRKVAALDLEPLMDGIVYVDDLLGTKLSFDVLADAFQIMALQLGVEPSEIIYVADNPNLDFVVPRRMGIGTIRIHRQRTEYTDVEPPAPEFEPHVTIDSLCLLADVLQTATFKS